MPRIRALTSVVGEFTWQPGEEYDVDEDTAAVWADGVRAERVENVKKAVRRAPETTARRTAETRVKSR